MDFNVGGLPKGRAVRSRNPGYWEDPASFPAPDLTLDFSKIQSFGELARRARLRNLVESDFWWVGDSVVVKMDRDPPQAILLPVGPTTDMDVICHFSDTSPHVFASGESPWAPFLGSALLDASGNGRGGLHYYYDPRTYLAVVSAYYYSTYASYTATVTAHADGRDWWTCLSKRGTDYAGRISIDGSTWTSTGYASASVAITQAGFMTGVSSSSQPKWVRLHSIRVYQRRHPTL